METRIPLRTGNEIPRPKYGKTNRNNRLAKFVDLNEYSENILDYVDELIAGIGSNKITFVENKKQLPEPENGVITLEGSRTYFLVDVVDLEGDRIFAEKDTTILGPSSENSGLKSTGLPIGVPLLSTESTLPIRHISFIGVDTAINIDGKTSSAYDWTGVNFVNVKNIGSIKDASNFIFNKGAFLDSQNMVFEGTVDTIAFSDSIFVGDGTTTKPVIEIDGAAEITRRLRINDSSIVSFGSCLGLDVKTGATIPTEGFKLTEVNFSGGGTYLNGLDHTDNRSLFQGCRGITNTAVSGQMYMQNNAVATTISNTTDFFKIAGITLPSPENSFYGHTNNRLTNQAEIERTYRITCTLDFESGNNNICQFGFFDSKLGDIREPSKRRGTANSSGRDEGVALECVVKHKSGHYLEIWGRNTSAATDITVTGMNVVVTEVK